MDGGYATAIQGAFRAVIHIVYQHNECGDMALCTCIICKTKIFPINILQSCVCLRGINLTIWTHASIKGYNTIIVIDPSYIYRCSVTNNASW